MDTAREVGMSEVAANVLHNVGNVLTSTVINFEQSRLREGMEVMGRHIEHIEVVDNGSGFSPETRENLFAQGFTTRKDGHGLGLHSSALAAQLLGGQLSLESEGLGKGATATLRLPHEWREPRR